jgi:hypothetical protein
MAIAEVAEYAHLSGVDIEALAAELEAIRIVHVVLSLAYFPIGNRQTEHEILRRFVSPPFNR